MHQSTPSRLTLLVPGAVCLAVATAVGIQLGWSQREDAYWTPAEEATSLDEARDRVELLVEGIPVRERAADGQLTLDTGAGSRVLAPGDIRVRFNNAAGVTRGQTILFAVSLTEGIVLLVVAALLPAGGARIAATRHPSRNAETQGGEPAPATPQEPGR